MARTKGSKNKKAIAAPIMERRSGRVSENAPKQLPKFLEIVHEQSYFASNKGRLTNQEIVDSGLEFACTTGNVWNYKFK